MTTQERPGDSTDAIVLRPRFLQRRFWRWYRFILPVVIVLGVFTSVADLFARGWSHQTAIDLGGVFVLMSMVPLFSIISRAAVTVRGTVLCVREFLRNDIEVPLAAVHRVILVPIVFAGITRRSFVLIDTQGRSLATLSERGYQPGALAPLLIQLPPTENVPPTPMRKVRRQYPPASGLSNPQIAAVAISYALMIAGISLLVLSATALHR